MRVAAERGKEHGRAEPVFRHLFACAPRAEGAEDETAGPQPPRAARNELALLCHRYMSEDIQRHDRVERGGCNVQLDRVGVDEARLGDMVARQLDLNRGDVDAGYAVPARELARCRDAAPATELEDVGAVQQARVEIAHPIEDG